MKKAIIAETVIHYHEVEYDDELDMMDVIEEAKAFMNHGDTGYEAIEETLKSYEKKFGFEYSVKSNYCGTKSLDMEVEDIY